MSQPELMTPMAVISSYYLKSTCLLSRMWKYLLRGKNQVLKQQQREMNCEIPDTDLGKGLIEPLGEMGSSSKLTDFLICAKVSPIRSLNVALILNYYFTSFVEHKTKHLISHMSKTNCSVMKKIHFSVNLMNRRKN